MRLDGRTVAEEEEKPLMSTSEPTREPTPSERFMEAMRHIMGVPKAEMEKRAKQYRKERKRRKRGSSR
jgi:hypothetical protein